MKTRLELLQSVLKHQQRYLSFLTGIGPRVTLGVGAAAMVLILVAYHLSTPLSLAVWILGGVLGWVVFTVVFMGIIWLLRMLTRWQIANYETAIEKLEREE